MTDRQRLFLPPASKEILQYLRATPRQHSSPNRHAMVQLGVVQHLHHRLDGTRFGVVRAVYQALQPGVHHGAGTHGARLNCNKQLAVLQAVIAKRGARGTQRDDLCMSGRIALREVLVSTAAHDFSFADHDRSHRNLPGVERALRRTESFFHEELVSL
jgi:hypothetical protein